MKNLFVGTYIKQASRHIKSNLGKKKKTKLKPQNEKNLQKETVDCLLIIIHR